MVSREDIEGFLIRMDLDYEEVDEGMFLTRVEAGGAPVVVHYADALLLIRMKVMDMPTGCFWHRACWSCCWHRRHVQCEKMSAASDL